MCKSPPLIEGEFFGLFGWKISQYSTEEQLQEAKKKQKNLFILRRLHSPSVFPALLQLQLNSLVKKFWKEIIFTLVQTRSLTFNSSWRYFSTNGKAISSLQCLTPAKCFREPTTTSMIQTWLRRWRFIGAVTRKVFQCFVHSMCTDDDKWSSWKLYSSHHPQRHHHFGSLL